MGAGIINLRVGSQLVGIRTDTERTLQRARIFLAAWIDDDCGDIPHALDLVLDPPDGADQRGPRKVPQLRHGQNVLARSRSADDVLAALADVLGGILARQDDTRLWFAFRVLANDHAAVLVEAPPMTSSGDRLLAHAGIRELETWAIVVEPGAPDEPIASPAVRVPPPLERLDWAGVGLAQPRTGWQTFDLAGVVALHDAHADAEGHRPAETLAHFGRRHSAPGWFPLLRALADDGRVSMVHGRAELRATVGELIGSPPPDQA